MLLNKRISILLFLKQIRLDLIAISLYAVAVGFADRYSFLSRIEIPLTVTAIIGTALSLLLAFRTAQSYERWWEARTVWGSIVNDSRTMIRQVQTFGANERISTELAENQIIWCYALGESLRKLPFSIKVQSYLDRHCIIANNIPNILLIRQSKLIAELEINDYKKMQIDSSISRLCDAMGKCERIKHTVFPRSYSLLVHFLIYVFATLLPFGLADNYVFIEIFLTILIPAIFISIERTSIIMQDPFENEVTDTPVTRLAETIEINLKEMLGEKNIPVFEQSNDFYIM